MPFELLYTSTVTSPLTGEELDDLVGSARAANDARGVCGVILYHNRTFVQLIEGTEPAVRATFDKVRRDPRHTAVRVVAAGPTERLSFPGSALAVRGVPATALPRGCDAVEVRPATAGALLFGGLRADLAAVPDFDRAMA